MPFGFICRYSLFCHLASSVDGGSSAPQTQTNAIDVSSAIHKRKTCHLVANKSACTSPNRVSLSLFRNCESSLRQKCTVHLKSVHLRHRFVISTHPIGAKLFLLKHSNAEYTSYSALASSPAPSKKVVVGLFSYASEQGRAPLWSDER